MKVRHLLNAGACPPLLRYLWGWFCELTRAGGLTYPEIFSWAQLKGVTPKPWELKILSALDAALRDYQKGRE